ncbi:hypothetical protein KORDIASMS9_01943 [Kordia sp. SMS9]|uniref:hypothetical protein n=1 Tax=Kordia sp. SMS9 TaxID=2282170 RepID=UPI000E0D0192|nr:hypothetical protein [Kordia sp. SMS9]AXG69716.1 hypothetical protein KORDIASMS9_01943 [Kordia sp. SMS9]
MLHFFKGFTNTPKNASAKLYVTSHFSLLKLQNELRSFYKKNAQNKLIFKKIRNGFTVDIDIKNDSKKELITATRLQFLQNKTVVRVVAESIEIELTSYQETKKAVDFNLKKQAFFTHLQNFLLTLQNDHLYVLKNEEQLPFVASADLETQNFIFHQLETNEYVLSILGVSEVVFKTVETAPKHTIWHFVLTSTRTFLLGKHSESDFVIVKISPENFTIQERTGKDLITVGNLSFYTEFMNDAVYLEMLPVIIALKNRLTTFGDLLARKYTKKEAHLLLASKVYNLDNTAVDSLCNTLKSELILQLKRGKISAEQEENWLEIFTNHIPKHATFGQDLVQIVTDWQLAFAEQQKILRILQPFQKPETAKHTIAFHEHISQLFLEKEKKAESIFEFNLNYAQHLHNAAQFSEAISVYRTIYESLPDDSITDLLPKKTTNIFNGEGGRQLKVTILEAILEIQEKLNADVSKTVHQLAELQPLVASRIEALYDHEKYQPKAETIKEILHTKTFNIATELPKSSFQNLQKKEILPKVVPSCFKDAKGFFDSLNNFIADLNPPDYNAVITFSDRLNAANYPKIFLRLTEICTALQMDVPECYIGRGNYANAVIGVEGKPSFLIVGIDFLAPNNIRYLELNALTFLITIELAHMYFEHSKITATDVWRGAADKGFSLINMLLTILPFAGNIGTLFGNAKAIEKYGTILQRVEQVANAAEKGKEIKDVSDTFNLNPFSKKTTQTNTSENLLITSRLMEIIADKVALLFCDDLKAAVKGLLVGTKFYEEYHSIITEHGVQHFLSQTNEQDEFVHQELIIRLKSLCAFYVSDTFENLQKQLYSS